MPNLMQQDLGAKVGAQPPLAVSDPVHGALGLSVRGARLCWVLEAGQYLAQSVARHQPWGVPGQVSCAALRSVGTGMPGRLCVQTRKGLGCAPGGGSG